MEASKIFTNALQEGVSPPEALANMTPSYLHESDMQFERSRIRSLRRSTGRRRPNTLHRNSMGGSLVFIRAFGVFSVVLGSLALRQRFQVKSQAKGTQGKAQEANAHPINSMEPGVGDTEGLQMMPVERMAPNRPTVSGSWQSSGAAFCPRVPKQRNPSDTEKDQQQATGLSSMSSQSDEEKEDVEKKATSKSVEDLLAEKDKLKAQVQKHSESGSQQEEENLSGVKTPTLRSGEKEKALTRSDDPDDSKSPATEHKNDNLGSDTSKEEFGFAGTEESTGGESLFRKAIKLAIEKVWGK